MKRRYVVWAKYPDGFDVLVCDRGQVFSKREALRLSRDPGVVELYREAKLSVALEGVKQVGLSCESHQRSLVRLSQEVRGEENQEEGRRLAPRRSDH